MKGRHRRRNLRKDDPRKDCPHDKGTSLAAVQKPGRIELVRVCDLCGTRV